MVTGMGTKQSFQRVTSVDFQPIARFPTGKTAKRWCITGLGFSWIAGIASLAVGIHGLGYASKHNYPQWIPLDLSWTAKEVIPLLLNVVVTLLEYAMGYIHTAALRWALAEQRDHQGHSKLTFNSNLRLFTYPKHYHSMGFGANMINGGFMALNYTAVSFFFASLPIPAACHAVNDLSIQYNCEKPQSYWCPSAFVALGVAFLGQAAITTWQLFSVSIPTWESDPIITAWACVAGQYIQRQNGRCMMSVNESSLPTQPFRAKEKQDTQYSAHKQVRRVVTFVWCVVLYCLAWFIILYVVIEKVIVPPCQSQGFGCSAASGSDWSIIPDTNGLTSLAQIDTVDFNEPGGSSASSQLMTTGVALTVIILMAFQAMLTMGLNCAELLVNVSRDEDAWREATRKKGHRHSNAILDAVSSWKSMALFAAKPFVHWIYGMAISFYFGWGIFLRPPQALYLTISMALVAIYGTVISILRPKGPQPATYGHLQTLVNLIDYFDENIHWGDKGFARTNSLRTSGYVRYAGTAPERLAQVRHDAFYE